MTRKALHASIAVQVWRNADRKLTENEKAADEAAVDPKHVKYPQSPTPLVVQLPE